MRANSTGLWHLENGAIVYSFTADSQNSAMVGQRDRDRLVSVTPNAYGIETADGNQRTYWRVK